MLALCWHNVPAYYALNYAGIFDGGLLVCVYQYVTIVTILMENSIIVQPPNQELLPKSMI